MTAEITTAPVRVIDIPAAASAARMTASTLRPKRPSRWRWALVILTLGALPLVGCGIQEGTETSAHYPDSHYAFVQELPDGGSVLCVWAKSGYGGGVSCDWAGADR